MGKKKKRGGGAKRRTQDQGQRALDEELGGGKERAIAQSDGEESASSERVGSSPESETTKALPERGEERGEEREEGGRTPWPLRRSLAVCLFFALQTLLAASYYWQDEPWDERFAWRMFSSVRGLSCQVSVEEGLAPGEGPGSAHAPRGGLCPDGEGVCHQLRLRRVVHEVWIRLLRRGRRSVAEALAAERCATPGRRLFLSLRCPLPSARGGPQRAPVTLFDRREDLCARGDLR